MEEMRKWHASTQRDPAGARVAPLLVHWFEDGAKSYTFFSCKKNRAKYARSLPSQDVVAFALHTG
ncbi:hypothetical protein, partial [Sporolactobacillus terrae]|uniref:hypothetical protein n=1 Tax=Sporolactobacillus terrae TaxID=269673 RepID=UPI001C3F3992